MSKARLVITAVVIEGRTQAEVARPLRACRKGWVSKLLARYRAEGEAAFEPRSRRPKTSPTATPRRTVELIAAATQATDRAGLDAGADTIGWHLAHRHQVTAVAGHDQPDPDPRRAWSPPSRRSGPKSSYIRFEAEHAKRDLAVRLHPLPTHPYRRHTGETPRS